MNRAARWLTVAAIAAGAPLAQAGSASAGQGSGNPILAVSQDVLPVDRVTDITVTGTDFLVPPHAPGVDVFGGVYVFFGWVADPAHFGPSLRNSTNNDGTFGVSYAYPGNGGDANMRDDGSGVVRLVAFTQGGESGEATEFHMDDNGNWSTQLRVYGSTFSTTNPVTGETRDFDCTQVQCGVFTIGAHGKASATNEKFIPITFAVDAPAPQPAAPAPAPQPAAPAPAPATTTTTPATTTSTTPPTTTSTLAPASSVAAPAADVETDASPSPDGAIPATVESVASTGSSTGQIVLIAAVAGALAGVAVATVRRRARGAPAAGAQLISPNQPHSAGGTIP